MNIGLDLDGVLANFHGSWLHYHNKNYGTKLTLEDITCYSLRTVFQITGEEVIERLFEFYNSKAFTNIKPEPGSIDAVDRLAEKNNLSVITSRPLELQDKTEQWLQRHYPGMIKEVICTNQISAKGSAKILKSRVCIDHNIDILVEDATEYAEDVAKSDIPVILLTKPWNLRDTLTEGIIRADTWKGIMDEIEKIEKKNITA